MSGVNADASAPPARIASAIAATILGAARDGMASIARANTPSALDHAALASSALTSSARAVAAFVAAMDAPNCSRAAFACPYVSTRPVGSEMNWRRPATSRYPSCSPPSLIFSAVRGLVVLRRHATTFESRYRPLPVGVLPSDGKPRAIQR